MDLGTLGNLRDYLGGGMIVILIIFIIYDRFFSARSRQLKEADDSLIKILQTTIQELTKKVSLLETDLLITKKEVQNMRAENVTLTNLIQGRDAETVAYRNKVIETIDDFQETQTTMRVMNENIQRLISIIESHDKFFKNQLKT